MQDCHFSSRQINNNKDLYIKELKRKVPHSIFILCFHLSCLKKYIWYSIAVTIGPKPIIINEFLAVHKVLEKVPYMYYKDINTQVLLLFQYECIQYT